MSIKINVIIKEKKCFFNEVIFLNKINIRKTMIEKRDALNSDLRSKFSEKIKNKILSNIFYKEAKSIFCFIGFGSEVNTIGIIEDALKDGKKVYVPRVRNKEMKVIRIDSLDNLKPGVFGILEPEDGEELNEDCDLILMPGVAFTKEGKRLGYGGGYYDKYLAQYNSNTLKIAIAYSIQVIDFIPTESYDKIVDYIVTEDFTYKCHE